MGNHSARDPHIDGLRGGLIALVVVGHWMEAVGGWESPVLSPILAAICLFHMPAFAFVAGTTFRPARSGDQIRTMLSLLVIFQVLYLLAAGAGFEWSTSSFLRAFCGSCSLSPSGP